MLTTCPEINELVEVEGWGNGRITDTSDNYFQQPNKRVRVFTVVKVSGNYIFAS